MPIQFAASAQALAAALNIADRHQIPVYPVAQSKAPTCPHGLRDATTDPATQRTAIASHVSPMQRAIAMAEHALRQARNVRTLA